MSSVDRSSGRGGVKTLAIRLEPDRHAQLSLIAQLRGNTITDELQQAVEAHIATIKATPEFASQADSVLAELQREADARRSAIATLFGEGSDGVDSADTEPAAEPTTADTTPPSRGSRSRKASGSESTES